MSSVLRFLSFVPPTLLFILPMFGQVQGKLELIPGTDTYQVSVISTVDWADPSITDQAQFTLRAVTGEFSIDNLQDVNGQWTLDIPNISPVEAPGFDYFSFQLLDLTPSIITTANAETPLFTFTNGVGKCTYIEIIDDITDPFLPPNSQNSNIGNFALILNPSSTVFNSYEGYAADFTVDCLPLDVDGLAGTNPLLCYGDMTFLDVDVIGGREPYQVYLQGNGVFQTVQVTDFQGNTSFPDLSAGTYEITVIDERDSAVVVEIIIDQPNKLNVNLLADDAGCQGSLDGQVTAFVDGGTVASDYQHYWNTNPGVSMSSVIGMLDPGTYSVTVVDDNGCTETASDDVGTYSVIFLNPQIRDISCFGAYDAIIDLYPVSPSGPFTFEWSSNVTTGDFSSAWQLGAGNYEVTVTDNTGVCNETATFSVSEPDEIIVDYRLTEPQCYGDPGYIDIIAVENAAGAWHGDIIGNSTEVIPNTFEVEAGMPLRLVVTDDKGCEASEDFIIAAKQELQVDLGPDHEIKYGETIQFDADIFPQSGVAMEWVPNTFLDCGDCPNPEASPTESINYQLVLVDTNGCTSKDDVAVIVRKSRDIYIPNAFSPNQDGINDMFCPFGGFEVVSIQNMQVFDRWGGLVFENKDGFSIQDSSLKSGWNGTKRGEELDAGTYLYTMNVEFIDGEIVLYSGEVNLLR